MSVRETGGAPRDRGKRIRNLPPKLKEEAISGKSVVLSSVKDHNEESSLNWVPG